MTVQRGKDIQRKRRGEGRDKSDRRIMKLDDRGWKARRRQAHYGLDECDIGTSNYILSHELGSEW